MLSNVNGIITYNTFIALHKPQLVSSGVPEHYWQTLNKKLQDQIFDSSFAFQLVQIDYEDETRMPYEPVWSVIATRDIDKSDPDHIYLIDHAWTFKPNNVKNNLRIIPGLLERMCNLMQITSKDIEEQIEEVFRNIWQYAHSYAIAGNEFSVEERLPVWYVMDELGSGVIHSDNPNFRAVPFINVPDQLTYTLLYPIENVEEGDTITRDFVEGCYSDPLQREAMLIPWKHYNHFDEDYNQEEPDENYFKEGHIFESLPNLEMLQNTDREITQKKLKVYSEYSLINENLTSSDFEIVSNEEEADILWLTSHFKNYEELSLTTPHKFVNQFPFEYVITVKDLLAIISRRCVAPDDKFDVKLKTLPVWLPVTFNMKTELSKFVAYYIQRKRCGLDNHWICKPYNLARGLDTYISDNLNFLCRLPLTGPKIAQKYIQNPVLFERPDIGLVKFDIRYIILLKSVNPLQLYVYNNFFLRFANKVFALNNFEDYEQHFTVMNYSDGVTLFRMLCEDFKEEWHKQYSNYRWDDVEKSIFEMFVELFKAASSKEPPLGIGKSPQSRALYAADLMLSWDTGKPAIQPKLLEINWMPDCHRACVYYPDFYNDIFSVLFLNRDVSTCTKIL